MTIIDRDIEFYEGEVERSAEALSKCSLPQEPAFKARKAAAQSVLKALREYREAMA